jgi:hypothetical protein
MSPSLRRRRITETAALHSRLPMAAPPGDKLALVVLAL